VIRKSEGRDFLESLEQGEKSPEEVGAIPGDDGKRARNGRGGGGIEDEGC